MRTKFTPGPWHWEDFESKEILLNEFGKKIAERPQYFAPSMTDKFDKNLIAAAPDLLESLIEMRDRFVPNDPRSEVLQMADYAITKATGGKNND